MTNETVIVAGVGPGLGRALSLRFAETGARVAMLARTTSALRAIAAANAERLFPYACDVQDSTQVAATFDRIVRELGSPTCVLFNASTFSHAPVLETDPAEFERSWRVGSLGGFLVGQAAARTMIPEGRGTIVFTGATASIRGSAGFAAFAASKFALRAVAQSLARELGPKGIHVAHVVVDGQIGEHGEHAIRPDRLADLYVQLHAQDRSVWTHEVDVRPFGERF